MKSVLADPVWAITSPSGDSEGHQPTHTYTGRPDGGLVIQTTKNGRPDGGLIDIYLTGPDVFGFSTK